MRTAFCLLLLAGALVVSLAVNPARAQEPCVDNDGDGYCVNIDCDDSDPAQHVCINRIRIEPLYFDGESCFTRKVERVGYWCDPGINAEPLSPTNPCMEVYRFTVSEETFCY